MKTLGTILGLIDTGQQRRNVRVVMWMLLGLILMVTVYSVLFHYLMGLEGREFSWATGFYWTMTVMSTLGFGDITFESDIGRLFSVLVLVSGALFLLILLPFSIIQFIFAPWMDRRDAARTPRRVPDDVTGHILVTQIDPVSQALIARARRSGISHVVLVEDPTTASSVADNGYRVMVGPLDSPTTYRDAGIDRASLVVSTKEDTANTNIAFTVREVNKDVLVVVTADKPASVDVLELAGADHVVQLASTLGVALARRVVSTTGRSHIVGQFGSTRIAEAGARGTSLVGVSVSEAGLDSLEGARLLAVSEHGDLHAAAPDILMTDISTLILAGTDQELGEYDSRFGARNRAVESPVLILGGGRVGRAAAGVLISSGVPYSIVEQTPDRQIEGLRVVAGDAAELDNLKAAGLEQASAVLVTTHDDDMNVYLTLYCRRLRPDIQIISRATHERNVSTLYRAGADGVLSYAAVGATAIWNTLKLGERVVIVEGVELMLLPIPSTLVGRALFDPKIYSETGCHVVAITDEAGAILDQGTIPSNPKARLMVMGDRHAEKVFRTRYMPRR